MYHKNGFMVVTKKTFCFSTVLPSIERCRGKFTRNKVVVSHFKWLPQSGLQTHVGLYLYIIYQTLFFKSLKNIYFLHWEDFFITKLF